MSLGVKFSELASLEQGADCSDDFVIAHLCTDSRTIERGDTYLAIKGERFDGHEFVNAAVSSGASSLVVSESVNANVPSIKVADTVVSLGNIAKLYRKKFLGKVIGITGSNGKTTVKEMVRCICEEYGKVTATTSNNNNTIGVPLTLLSASLEDDVVVVEMGTSELGEIAYLSNIVEPDISVVTNVSESHLTGLGSKKEIFAEKSAIITATRREGVVVINQDDGFAREVAQLAGVTRILTYGFSAADVTGEYEDTAEGVNVSARCPAGAFNFHLAVSGRHNVANSYAAIAIACAIGVDVDSIVQGLEKYTGIKGRLQTSQLTPDITLIDDSYNANPASTHAALDILSTSEGRKIFVFGGMGELGDQEVLLHESIGKKASESNVDCLFALGDVTLPTVDKFSGEKYRFDSIEDLNTSLGKYIVAGDVVLVKGSRSYRMERVCRYLEKEVG